MLTAVGLVALLVLVRRPEPDDPSAPWYDAGVSSGRTEIASWTGGWSAGPPARRTPMGTRGTTLRATPTVDRDGGRKGRGRRRFRRFAQLVGGPVVRERMRRFAVVGLIATGSTSAWPWHCWTAAGLW
ncbi:MAG: hypothetical protein Ct9H300mP31_11930 [Acidimicrobiaceae bacterium]|nr:MAG: hypothetical protein Ct9H300mP31_11930 [Acidimicrobiaceae bacterium]